jgi:glycosyltransferase involved in cell wall biosynthesis
VAKKMLNQPQNLRIFIGIQEIAGYYCQLLQGLRELGCQADFYALNDHPFGYKQIQEDNVLTHLCRWLKRCESKTKRRSGKLFWLLLQDFIKVLLFFHILPHYDVFIFSYRSTFFHYLELPLLKMSKKRVIYVFHGSDARPPYMDGTIDFQDAQYLNKTTQKIKSFVSQVEKYADLIIVNPASAQFLSKPFINSMIIGVPFQCQPSFEPLAQESGAIQIVHGPSNPKAKGSAQILEVVKRVQLKYPEIQYIELRNRSHSEVLQALQSCDLVIDQLYSDTPLAGLATEAAFFGKPSIVGSYAHSLFEEYLDLESYPPSLVCHPEHLEEALLKLLLDVTFRQDLGRKAQAFVSEKWTPERVAQRYLKLIYNEIPQNWWTDPLDITYPYGAALSENQLQHNLKLLCSNYGASALQVKHHIALQKSLLEQLTTQESKGQL